MTTVDFQTLMKMLVDSPIGGRYSPVYLAIGFLSGALGDDEARADLIAYCSEHPYQMERVTNLLNKLQAVIAKAEDANF